VSDQTSGKPDPWSIFPPHDVWRHGLNARADAYDRHRPGYPVEVPTEIIALAGLHPESRILEIGCGTGQLTREFARRGYTLLALEPGPALATIARRNLEAWPNVRVEVTLLEDWIPEEPRFDLVLAAQSFHLVDQARRFGLVAATLVKGGALAVVWNYKMPGDTAAHRAVEDAYARHAPGHPPWQEWMDTPFENEIARSGLFGPVAVRTWRWPLDYTTAEFVGLTTSLGTHHALPGRHALIASLGEGIERAGGTIRIDYLTRLYVASVA
jgi:SAM-dependent methyltransferase